MATLIIVDMRVAICIEKSGVIYVFCNLTSKITAI